ncbi:E3 ubiquitin-protein ligase RNF216-like isoform X6 [Pomacea canaliculata]|uniref:E3 ubiquitin-protein ligase RNF216-like isoform X6 n=1 Tax=Pomacea canaliculata TaxID=400727 RepID=UPI000D73EA53|nr:E3 ubiquitin-protein ligase RNF216-like isoform X6 [Pomacea canaliculata]
MTASLQALKSELEKRSLVLDEEGLKVCGQLMEVFPSYAMESVSAVVAMLSKDFAGNSEGLMSACVDFLLDEDSPSLKAFLSETSQNKDPGSMTPDDKWSSGVTSVQLTAVTHGVTAGRQDPVPSTSGYRKRLNAEAIHTMASVNSQKEDGKSDASKRKESSGVDRWDYRDYPDIVIDDSLNDSQGSVQFMENSPQRAMNNPAGPLKTEQLPEHRGLDFAVQSVIEVFPNIEITYVRDMLKRFLAAGVVWNHALNNVLNQLLENPNFPTCLDSSHSVQLTKKPKKDYFNDYSAPVIVASSAIATAAWDLLSWDFRMIARNEIKQVMSRYNYHYAPVYRCLTKAMASTREVKSSSPDSKSRVITVVCHEGKGNEWKAVFYLLKKPRMLGKHVKEFIQHLPPELKAETEFVQDYLKQEKEESDRQIAWQLLEKEYYEEGQAIECGCCYTQYPFEKLVQCFDGHLFCCDCLQGYAREAIFGSGKLNLMCMTEGCETTFPKSQLIKALPDDVMQKYDERLAEESLNMAEISDLVRCPYCNLAAVLDANVQIFECPGPSCQKTTCRDCKEDWEDHMGKSCEEVEKKDETKLRKEYEEKMTSLKVRTCPRCKAQFFKEEGCNKMICRCGATMCYLCRKPSITYKHFCQHPRDPGKGCTQCTACSLWTNPDEDEKKAIAEVQREAQVQRKEHGYLDNKVIGVP